ncbi:MAG: DUF3012 domain-containing protein [Cycloclasticus sp.]|nr:DUF3012 domain-containing protein [Cycloclasticus sp.]
MKKIIVTLVASAFLTLLTACSPDIGTEQWCSDMKAKTKSDWSTSQATDFAKHCVFK